jgi:hypothetical protein
VNKTERKKLHAAINNLEPETMAAIVRKTHPRVRAGRWTPSPSV